MNKVIEMKKDIKRNSALCRFDKNSFFFMYSGKLLQISCKDWKVLFKKEGMKWEMDSAGMIAIRRGKYYLIENLQSVVIVIKKKLNMIKYY